jgi:hypothetical protein
MLDGQTLRPEFMVCRLDHANPVGAAIARCYPACRLALPANAVIDLTNRVQQTDAALAQAGVLRPSPVPS